MEDFVTFEQAKKLKELGFDWECFAYYLYDDNLEIGRQLQKYNSEWHLINLGYISAPTLSQAQKWLREEKHLLITIERDKEYGKFGCVIYRNDSLWKSDIVCDMNGYNVLQLTAIDKALELLT